MINNTGSINLCEPPGGTRIVGTSTSIAKIKSRLAERKPLWGCTSSIFELENWPSSSGDPVRLVVRSDGLSPPVKDWNWCMSVDIRTIRVPPGGSHKLIEPVLLIIYFHKMIVCFETPPLKSRWIFAPPSPFSHLFFIAARRSLLFIFF